MCRASEFTRGVEAEWTKSGSGTMTRLACASETMVAISAYAPVPTKWSTSGISRAISSW